MLVPAGSWGGCKPVAVTLGLACQSVWRPSPYYALSIHQVLEDLAITVHIGLIGSKVPYCAFNGGNDVFVDIGNKNIGLKALQTYFDAKPDEVRVSYRLFPAPRGSPFARRISQFHKETCWRAEHSLS